MLSYVFLIYLIKCAMSIKPMCIVTPEKDNNMQLTPCDTAIWFYSSFPKMSIDRNEIILLKQLPLLQEIRIDGAWSYTDKFARTTYCILRTDDGNNELNSLVNVTRIET